ncbi:MAG: excinuclease ABC subunit C [Bacilli bacterium]|nr:excinuclease ABC subunit C [Bacilli bacterium]
MKERLKKCIENLKHLPGVYLMHDENDTIIYIGKAKDLQKRVSQYFLRPQTGKVLKMRDSVEYFETIITQNEKEAFVLEMNLIQTHYPKFNVLLMDDKHYPYIAIKKKNDPYLTIKRNKKDRHYDYFGPFPSASLAKEMIVLLNKIFPTRKCRNIPSTPCLYFHMGQCLAPCIKEISEEENNKLVEEIKSFLRGNNHKIREEMRNKMNEASDNLEFEKAAEYKKVIDAIDHINTIQNVEVNDRVNRDIFAYSSREGYIALAILLYRNGVLLGKKVFVLEAFGEEMEQVSDLILQFYLDHEAPDEVIINSDEVVENLRDLLECEVISKSKGKIHDLVLTAKENASNALDEYFLSARLDDDKLLLLEELGNLLHIKTPLHIELFDNSHLQGSQPVGAMVAFINGEPAKKLYRKFHIHHEESRDDLMSMKEVISRHYLRSKNENKKLPDLILTDGGLIQVEAAIDALNSIEVDIPVFGLYKNDKHQTEGLIDKEGNTYPIINKSLFFLLTRMQDEVHRFAITFHKELRLKSQTASIFDGINGLGKKRRELLEKAYPDINLLKQASIEELSQLLPYEVAKELYEKLHS